MIGGALIVAALTAALGSGVGVLVRNQVAGVVGALIWLFILAPLLGLIDEGLPSYTTLAGAAAVVGGSDERRPAQLGAARWSSWSPGRSCSSLLGLIAEKRRDID